MGFKRFAEYFKIDPKRHIVQVCDQRIMIGSGYIHDLAVVDMHTGILTLKSGWASAFECYPELTGASSSLVLSVIGEPDEFSNSIPVFISSDGQVHEDFCEVFGYPHVTHTGRLMYENTSFLCKDKALNHAIGSLTYRVESWKQRRSQLLKDIEDIDRELDATVAQKEALKAEVARLRAGSGNN